MSKVKHANFITQHHFKLQAVLLDFDTILNQPKVITLHYNRH